MAEVPRMLALKVFRRLFGLTGYRGWRLAESLYPWLAPDRPVVTRVEGHRMLLDLREKYNWRLFKWGMSFAEEYQPFCDSIKPGMTVLDVGANVGVFTLAAARLAGASGRVIAFDPLPRNYRYLVANVVLNGYENVEVEGKAVSNRDGQLEINLFGSDNVSVSEAVTGKRGKEKLTVDCCKLDTYVEDQGLGKVDVVKVDVEGAEGFVLEGMQGILEAHKPILFMEIHPDFLETVGWRPRDVLKKLQESGYRAWYLGAGGHVTIDDLDAFPIPYDAKKRPLNCFRVCGLPEDEVTLWPPL